ncbi:hypothetical protein [Nonomuraea zeae]|uniref:Uncharacterized protein n=1 Tax=Nonomuraea zeae TaxID=1642303 RepID=A0A5S4G180_9ACTN|nr:hypothetical protein [Nonomuraea zeae]TMR26726.1 hypothetical protein ETD85_41630 [Nonomuraea zeae]
MLGLPYHRLQQLTLVSELDDLPLHAIRRITHALNLAWPTWLEPAQEARPSPDPPDTTHLTAERATFDDADRIRALLASALGHPLTRRQIADVLGWSLKRVQAALPHLTLARQYLQLIPDDASAELALPPRALPAGARDRLHRLLLRQHGPTPALAYIAYRIGARNNSDALTFAQRHPDTISGAQAAGLLTYSISDDGHRPQTQPRRCLQLGDRRNLHDALLLDQQEKPM